MADHRRPKEWEDYLAGNLSPDSHPHYALEGHMGICGCGNPAAVYDLLLKAMTTGERFSSSPDRERPVGIDGAKRLIAENPEGAGWLLLYFLDGCGFTEHGGSVNGAWLEPQGEKAVEVLRNGPPKEEW